MVRRVLLCLVCLVGSTAGPGVAQDSSVFVLPERTPAPAFTLPDLSGRPVSSAAFGGKIVILSFGATWCTTCTTELKSLENLQARFPKDLLVYFGKRAWRFSRLFSSEEHTSELQSQSNLVCRL